MRMVVGFLLLVAPLFGEGIPREEYQARRAELRKTLDGVLVLFSAADDDLRDYVQEPNFLYLTGWRDPGAVLMMTANEEILFLPPRDKYSEIFYGRVIDSNDPDVFEKTGFKAVLPKSAVETTFLRLIENSPKIYAVKDARAEKLKALAPLHPEGDTTALVGALREMKSPAELALIQKASDATVAAHLAAWHAMKAGKAEYEIAAVMTNTYFSMGCERSAYAPIVGSGPNGVILHYSANKRRMDAGEMVVMDVGAECSDYATDVTRSVPVNGKFTARQKEIYEIVLGAQKAAIAAVRPGAKVGRKDGEGLYKIAFDYINTHGKDLHGAPLGKYFTHGLSHHVGLDVHDPGPVTVELKAGMVITIEPGIYIPEENIGVRIEDTVLVTANGCKILSGALPREVEEIERLVGK